jgi:ferredoxin
MAISKVWIIDGCIACGVCADTCPEVFELEDLATVKTDVDYGVYEKEIKEAAADCPVEVIRFE